MNAPARAAFAPAKINLTLRVVGRRADGYHDLESLVVFATVGDALSFVPGPTLALALRGPTAAHVDGATDNLVLKASRALAERVRDLRLGRFALTKRLPVAAGLGGGSADAAAALRLLARANHIALDDPRLLDAARATGSDVPVCLDPHPRVMRGIGDLLSSPLNLPRFPAVLVNPGIRLATKDVFAAIPSSSWPGLSRESTSLDLTGKQDVDARDKRGHDVESLVASLLEQANDLEPAAIGLAPVIADVLAALRALGGCRLARMSGSGPTCFALFASVRAATQAARVLRADHPQWWIRATVLNGRPPSAP